MRCRLLPLLAALAAASVAPAAEPADAPTDAPTDAAATQASVPLGQVHPVTCGEDDGAFTVHLYVPKAYDPARRWPVVYGFSPEADAGNEAAQRWAPVAESRGWIVAWSNRAATGRFRGFCGT